jgi:type II secretory pathway pseudopilin PulG
MQFLKKQKLNTGPARNATHNVAGGFTLVETLVAISIFTGAILSLLTFSGGSIGDTTYSKNKLVATFLAQEGLEYVKNLRDTYVLFESDGWTAFRLKVAPCDNNNGCYLDASTVSYAIPSQQAMKNLTITTCSGTCPKMYYDNSNNITITKYNYNPAGQQTNFIRKIEVKNLNYQGAGNPGNSIEENKEIIIISSVYWTKGNQTYSVTFSNYLKNWAE